MDAGASSIATGPYTLRELAADAIAVLDAAGSTDLWETTDAAMALGALAPRAALARQWDLDLTVDTLDRLPELRVPVHVIWSDEDRLVPPNLPASTPAGTCLWSTRRMRSQNPLPLF